MYNSCYKQLLIWIRLLSKQECTHYCFLQTLKVNFVARCCTVVQNTEPLNFINNYLELVARTRPHSSCQAIRQCHIEQIFQNFYRIVLPNWNRSYTYCALAIPPYLLLLKTLNINNNVSSTGHHQWITKLDLKTVDQSK